MLITSSSSPLSGYFSYVFFYSFYICLCLIFYVSIYILEVTLPYEPVCTSVSLGWWVGLSANISYKGLEVSLTCSYRLSDFPMNPHVRLSVGWLVFLSVIISSFTSHAPIGLFIHMYILFSAPSFSLSRLSLSSFRQIDNLSRASSNFTCRRDISSRN